MKKRIMAILFAMTLVAAMLPAGLAVTAAAEENLILNGSFELATEESDTIDEKLHGAKNWPVNQNGLGTRVLYSDTEIMGDLEPVAGTGDACFALTPNTPVKNEALQQVVKLEAGKKYTISFLFYKKYTKQYIKAGIKFNTTYIGNSPGMDVKIIDNVNYTAVSTEWKRVSKTFVVPGTPGELVDSVFNLYMSTSGADGSVVGYVDDVRLVEAKNQETTVWSTDGFDSLAKAGMGVINEPGFPFSANSYFYGSNDAGDAIARGGGGSIWDTATTDFVTYEDGNTVLRMSTSSLGISKVILDVPQVFADANLTVGTPLRISYKVRLVDIPDDLDTAAKPTFGPYVAYAYTNCPTYEPYIVGSNKYEPEDGIKDASSNVVADGTQIYLEIPTQYTTGLIPVSLSTQNVNETNKNANEWVEYEVIIPYTGEIKQAILTTGVTNAKFGTSLPVGYSYEIDDLEVTIADTAVLPGSGALDGHTFSIWDSSTAKVVQGWSNPDGTGDKYKVDPSWQHGWDDWRTVPYYRTVLNADKSVKTYAKEDTAAGAAYISAEDAAGASVVTAVYKTVDGDRTLVGVNVKNAAAGLVAAPEVALSAITEEAGTYEVATYILALTTGTLRPLGESAIVQIQ